MTHFQEVTLMGRKAGKCRCRKRRTRTEKFFQTLNPYNKNKAGEIKTRVEILEELSAEKSKWMAEPITCPTCPPVQKARKP